MHSYQLSQVSHVYLSIPVSDFAWLDYCHIVYLGLKFSSFTSTLFQVFCTWSHSKCRQSFPAQHLQVTQTAAMPRAIPLPSLSDWRHRSRALADVTRSSSALVTSWILNCVVTLGEQMLFVAEVSGSVDQVSRSWVTLAPALGCSYSTRYLHHTTTRSNRSSTTFCWHYEINKAAPMKQKLLAFKTCVKCNEISVLSCCVDLFKGC